MYLLDRSEIFGEVLGLALAEVIVIVDANPGAVTHVLHPNQLPAGCAPTGATGDHFTGVGCEHIECFGKVDAVLIGLYGPAACAWDCADVTRAFHLILTVSGPEYGEGMREVLFTNRRAGLVSAGFAEKILEQVTLILEYNGVGNLYLGELKL